MQDNRRGGKARVVQRFKDKPLLKIPNVNDNPKAPAAPRMTKEKYAKLPRQAKKEYVAQYRKYESDAEKYRRLTKKQRTAKQ